MKSSANCRVSGCILRVALVVRLHDGSHDHVRGVHLRCPELRALPSHSARALPAVAVIGAPAEVDIATSATVSCGLGNIGITTIRLDASARRLQRGRCAMRPAREIEPSGIQHRWHLVAALLVHASVPSKPDSIVISIVPVHAAAPIARKKTPGAKVCVDVSRQLSRGGSCRSDSTALHENLMRSCDTVVALPPHWSDLGQHCANTPSPVQSDCATPWS